MALSAPLADGADVSKRLHLSSPEAQWPAIDIGSGPINGPPHRRASRQRVDSRHTAAADDWLSLTAKSKTNVGEEAVTQQHLCAQQMLCVAGFTGLYYCDLLMKGKLRNQIQHLWILFPIEPHCWSACVIRVKVPTMLGTLAAEARSKTRSEFVAQSL